MNLLICGAGKGSWQMRGLQLGAALGARVTSSPTDADFAWCDLVVLIKKHAVNFAPRAHAAGKPIVWDAVDFWSQPAQNSYNEAAAVNALQAHIRVIRPVLTIGATKAMAKACDGAYLPHHCHEGLSPTPPREHVAVVAYEGNAAYLGRWHGWLTDACQKRGWSFVVNPPDLSDADIIVAFRDGVWDGWICREWKSGVKVVNAIAAGRPLISQSSAAVSELLTGQANRPAWSCVESPTQLGAALDEWAPLAARSVAADELARLAAGYSIATVAEQYRQILAERGLACST